MFRRLFAAALVLACAGTYADNHPTVQDLAWMSGSWDGPIGENVLEENWGLPRAGTIVSLVRSTGPGGTQMVEIVSIEEANGTLDLYIQQWDVPFTPRTPAAQKMTLKEKTKNSVTFQAVDEGSLSTLMYSRPTDDTFHVDVTTPTGQAFTIKLKTQER